METANVSRTSFRTAFVLLLVLVASALFLAVVWPFLMPLLLGALLAGLCQPLYRWVTRLLGGRKSLAAALTLVILFLVVAGPLSAFVGLVVGQALSVSNEALPWVQQHFGAASAFNAHDWLVQRFPSLADYVPAQGQIVESAAQLAKSAGAYLVARRDPSHRRHRRFSAQPLRHALRDVLLPPRWRPHSEKILYYTPLRHADEERVLERLGSVTRATIKGTLVIGIIQGALAGIGFWVAGLDGAAFWGTIMAVLSIVPGIGAALVWVPAVIYLFVTGQTLTAILLFAWCAAVVGTVDNCCGPRWSAEMRKCRISSSSSAPLAGCFSLDRSDSLSGRWSAACF